MSHLKDKRKKKKSNPQKETTEKNFSPFYTETTKDLFHKLLSVPPIDDLDSESVPLKGFTNNKDTQSVMYNKFTNVRNTNCLKAYYKSLRYLPGDGSDQEDTMTRSRKIRFFPTTKQKQYFNKCFGTTRYIYNKTINTFKTSIEKQKKKFRKNAKLTGCLKMITIRSKSGRKRKSKRPPKQKQCCAKLKSKFFCVNHLKTRLPYRISTNFIDWRNKIVKSNDKLSSKEEWMKDIPSDTRQLVIRNVLGGIKSAFTNLKKGHIKHFDMKFKSKKNSSQFFLVDSRALNKDMHLWKQKLSKPLRFKKKEKQWIKNLMEQNVMKNMIISRERNGKYFIQIPYTQSMNENVPTKKIVSIDPGVITFHTFYSPQGECGKIGDGFSKALEKDNNLIAETQAYISGLLEIKSTEKEKEPSERKTIEMKQLRKDIRRLRKKLIRIRTHIKNRIKDLHQKAIKYYCDNYKNILLPNFDAVRIARRLKQQGMKKQARKTMELSHRTFIQRLKTKVSTYENCRLFLVGEHYTSQTCGNCGVLNPKIKRSRIINCFNCGYNADRDMNAARNVLINHVHSSDDLET